MCIRILQGTSYFLVAMYFFGFSLNIMSLGGLALGVGMLVDNSIVVLENIYRYREKGSGPMDAAYQGTKEVALPVAASTLTTIALPKFDSDLQEAYM